MTDASCGCPCRDCREQDNHRCGLRTCGYTKYLRARRERPKPAAVGDLKDPIREKLRPAWRKFSTGARKRLTEWAKCVEETAHLDRETRERVRREKHRELYG